MVMLLGIAMLRRMFIMEDVFGTVHGALMAVSESPVVILLMVNLFMIVITFTWLPTLVIVTYVPDVSLFLPRLLLGCCG